MRVLIADNVPNVQVGLRVLLEQQPGFEVVGEVVNAGELLDYVKASCPDLLLLGWELPGLAGVESLSALRMTCPNLFVIVLSGRTEARRAALAAGADAFVSKVAPPERLLAAVLSIRRIEKENDLLSESKNSSTNDESKEKIETDMRRLMMSELSTQASAGSKENRGNTAIIVASVSAAVVALACIATFIVTTILVLDAIPFRHIFPH